MRLMEDTVVVRCREIDSKLVEVVATSRKYPTRGRTNRSVD